MFTQTVTVKEKDTQNIIIGRRGTYGTEEIVFDLSWLVDVYGNGSAVLMVKRPVDETAYPAVTARDGNNLIWTVGDVDTSYKGHGECELFWYVDESLAKSVIYSIAILRDIGETEEAPPDPYQTWVDTLTDLGAETLENARQAAQSAEDAESAKVDAVEAKGQAQDAQEKAEIAQGKAETAQGKAEDAQEAAEIAVTHYPKIVNSYWYVWQNGQWVNTGVKAEGSDGREIVSVTCEKTGTSGLVDTYTMTITYNSGNPDTVQFLVTNGEDGYNPVVTIITITGGHRVTITDKTHLDGQSFDVTDGIDGVSPEVTITEITGGHRVTITDEDHPLGQSFDVMDGTNTDAEHVTYDDTASYSDGTVGKALSQLNSAISEININKADVIISSASGAIASFSDGMEAPIKGITIQIEPVQSGSGDPSPTNVRPISGWIGANIERSREAITFVSGGLTDTTGTEATNAARGRTDYLPYESGPLSVYMVNGRDDSTMRIRGFYFYNASKKFISNTIDSLNPATLPYTYTEALPEGTKYIRICIQHAGGTATVVAENYSIAINPTTYPITFPSAAGTVYGGTLEVNEDGTGTLTVDKCCDTFDGSNDESWQLGGTLGSRNWFRGAITYGYINAVQGITGVITDSIAVLPAADDSTGTVESVRLKTALLNSTEMFLFVPTSLGIATVEALRTYLNSHPYQICYPLGTPLVYTLTAEQVGSVITTLYGDNNVWADTGDVSLDYRADTKLYIEKLTAPTEDDLIANAPIASGKFFMIGNTLYLSTASIASGAQITVGTNAVKLSLADALNQINS